MQMKLSERFFSLYQGRDAIYCVLKDWEMMFLQLKKINFILAVATDEAPIGIFFVAY